MTFSEALPIILGHEGGYANHPNDKGKETYRGISRRWHPLWAGWKIVDEEKLRRGSLPNNYIINDPLLNRLVVQFYKTEQWDAIRMDDIKDDSLQRIIFDAYVNSGGDGIKVLQSVLNRNFGKNLKVDGAQGKKTIDAINSVNPQQLFEAFKTARVNFYNAISKGDNAAFNKGWMNRISSFNYKAAGLSLGVIAIIGVAGFFLSNT